MRTSNKLLLFIGAFTTIYFSLLLLNYKPDYRQWSLRNISDQFKVVCIQDSKLTPDNVFYTEALTKEETYISYKEGNIGAIAGYSYQESMDTLFVKRASNYDKNIPLHLHLKGVDEVLLGKDIIYQRGDK
ncbi:hypothetical protein [Massilibacteroides sp.]|uniref:hypothetical protein n=1 Tax=Massilibacteroides sp. TaxID=2034766 RepID=UPI00260A894E|nr:hypothetical protein [Massilibacteroides sp.]MDD4515698.1 hypothetical protein [Massilibacteroides sp.]